jgi:hAT family C-terminal dimerisation region
VYPPQQYKKATLFFSCNTASVTTIILTMDKLDGHLNTQSKTAYHPSIQAAMTLARKKMNRYYVLTDLSSVYRIAMVLYPGLKLEYFKQHDWDPEWIEVAEELTSGQFTKRYRDLKDGGNSDNGAATAESSNIDEDDGVFADFVNISVAQSVAPKSTELDEYLRLLVENVKDPLRWWYGSRFLYPTLHRMALDYLSIPGKSPHAV